MTVEEEFSGRGWRWFRLLHSHVFFLDVPPCIPCLLGRSKSLARNHSLAMVLAAKLSAVFKAAKDRRIPKRFARFLRSAWMRTGHKAKRVSINETHGSLLCAQPRIRGLNISACSKRRRIAALQSASRVPELSVDGGGTQSEARVHPRSAREFPRPFLWPTRPVAP